MRRTVDWLSPGDPSQRTGGYIYNARLSEALAARGCTIRMHPLPGIWPLPNEKALTECAGLLRQIPPGSLVVADGLVWPGLTGLRNELCRSHTVIVVVHSLLDKEYSAPCDSVAELEARALNEAHGWICTSADMQRLMSREILEDGANLKVVCPGVDQKSRSRGNDGASLLCVSNVIPRKGIRDLLRAVSRLGVSRWTLDIAGSLQRDRQYAECVLTDAEALGIAENVRFHGELTATALDALYDSTDILVHTAHFEAFGMSLTEAAARNIPIVSTPAGALQYLPEGSYLKVPVGDADSLASKLRTLIADPSLRDGMRSAASKFETVSWDSAAGNFVAAVDEIAVSSERALQAG